MSSYKSYSQTRFIYIFYPFLFRIQFFLSSFLGSLSNESCKMILQTSFTLQNILSPCNMKNKLMPLYDKILLRKRSVIETINDELKNVAQLVHSRHRSVFNFVMNVLSVLAAYSFFEKKQSVNIDYCIENVDGQLAVIK